MLQKLMHLTLLLVIFTTSLIAQDKTTTHNLSTYFTSEKKYLVLPVKNGAPKRNVELWVDGINTRFFDIELAEGTPDWYAYIQIDEWAGKPVELRVDQITDGSKVFTPIQQSDLDTNAGQLYKEKLRAQFHFSPKRGWTNDPNGMVYFNGQYHLFFQHNPYGREWGNMTWGHAVSKDLIHWKELDDALHPDAGGPVFSGGAVVDAQNTSGFGSAGKPAMVMFHTGAKAWGQFLSWSTDALNFKTLTPAVVPRINKDNRDPKVVWYEPTKRWIMVVYVERENDQHSMQFLTSPDLKTWTPASIVLGGKGDDTYLFECPEFYELPVGETPEKKWVLTAANGKYAIGSFDGTTFKPEEERLVNQVGRDFYASQTFSNEPTGRRIEIGWWRTNTAKEEMSFNQSMSIPIEHKLVKTPQGIRLTRTPVKELETLRSKTYPLGNFSLKEKSGNPLKNISIELAEMHLDLEPLTAKQIIINVRGIVVTYNVLKQELVVDGVTCIAPLQNGKLNLIIFSDRTGLEIFINKGLQFMPINKNIADDNRMLSLSAIGGTAKFFNVNIYQLKSIWDNL